MALRTGLTAGVPFVARCILRGTTDCWPTDWPVVLMTEESVHVSADLRNRPRFGAGRDSSGSLRYTLMEDHPGSL